MADNEDCSAIIRAVASLGRSLGMTVNAEGVETESQLAALRAESLDEVQGYLFSEPIPNAEVRPLIERFGSAQDADDDCRAAPCVVVRPEIVPGVA